MSGYFKSHRWMAGAGAAVFALALLVTACGGGSRLASDKNQPGGTTGGSDALSRDTSESQIRSMDDSKVLPSSGELAAPEDASGTSSGPSTGGAPNVLPSTLDRKIIQTATLQISTDEVSKKFEDVGNIAAAAGGFISSSSFGNSGENQTASITIRVPGENYQRALNDLRRLGEVKGEQSSANDVTEEFTDLQSRLRNLQATEAQYLTFLQRAGDLSDVLTVQDRLNQVRAEIEQVQGRIDLVEHQTDLATITVHLDPPVVAKVTPKDEGSSNPLEVAADSFQASLAVLLGIATVALAVAAFSWWIVPLAIAGGLIARRQTRATGGRAVMPPPTAPAA